jgi:hypothetical protein
LSACGARQITEEWGELNPNWHLEAFGAFYTPFWAAYGVICKCSSLSFEYISLKSQENHGFLSYSVLDK